MNNLGTIERLQPGDRVRCVRSSPYYVDFGLVEGQTYTVDKIAWSDEVLPSSDGVTLKEVPSAGGLYVDRFEKVDEGQHVVLYKLAGQRHFKTSSAPFNSKKEATEAAERKIKSFPGREYYVCRVTTIVRTATPQFETVEV